MSSKCFTGFFLDWYLYNKISCVEWTRIQRIKHFSVQGRLKYIGDKNIFLCTKIRSSPTKLVKYPNITSVYFASDWASERYLNIFTGTDFWFFTNFLSVVDDEQFSGSFFFRLSYRTRRFLHQTNLHFKCKSVQQCLRKRWNRKSRLFSTRRIRLIEIIIHQSPQQQVSSF